MSDDELKAPSNKEGAYCISKKKDNNKNEDRIRKKISGNEDPPRQRSGSRGDISDKSSAMD